MNKLSKLAIATVLAFPCATMAVAQESAHSGHQSALADGEIKKIDKDTGKFTIRHGELRNLGMPAMTMVFRAKDAAMLDQVKVGDKVRFAAERANGDVTVVHLENAN
jgi:Cu(I)/Ag(I) efflux system protein CusF